LLIALSHHAIETASTEIDRGLLNSPRNNPVLNRIAVSCMVNFIFLQNMNVKAESQSDDEIKSISSVNDGMKQEEISEPFNFVSVKVGTERKF
jgi:hypothetical protein